MSRIYVDATVNRVYVPGNLTKLELESRVMELLQEKFGVKVPTDFLKNVAKKPELYGAMRMLQRGRWPAVLMARWKEFQDEQKASQPPF